MQSEPNTQEIDPREVGITPESEPPGRIYKQVVREVLARIDQRLADIEKQAVTEPSDGQSPARARGWLGRRLKRGFVGALVVAGVIGAAVAWQRFDGDAAKAMVARMTPRFVVNMLSTPDNQEGVQDTGAVTVGTAGDGRMNSDLRSTAMDAAAGSPDRMAPDGDGQTAAAPADLATTIEKMSRDITTLTQGIEQLKASQEQMSRDNAKATEQFKASEDQLIRMLLRVSEQQSPQPRTAAPTQQARTPQTRTAATPARGTAARPRQALPSFFSRRPT